MTDAPEDTKQPPPGILAEQVLTALNDKKVPDHDVRLDTAAVSEMPPDPNYVEPHSLGAFQTMADTINAGCAGTAVADLSVVAEQRMLIKFLLARIKTVEDALMPFAMNALVMSNARMCLIADGRGTEPAGGTWISKVPGGIQLQPNEGYFFNACDAAGRARTNNHMASILERVRQATALQGEKDAHVNDGGKLQ